MWINTRKCIFILANCNFLVVKFYSRKLTSIIILAEKSSRLDQSVTYDRSSTQTNQVCQTWAVHQHTIIDPIPVMALGQIPHSTSCITAFALHKLPTVVSSIPTSCPVCWSDVLVGTCMGDADTLHHDQMINALKRSASVKQGRNTTVISFEICQMDPNFDTWRYIQCVLPYDTWK